MVNHELNKSKNFITLSTLDLIIYQSFSAYLRHPFQSFPHLFLWLNHPSAIVQYYSQMQKYKLVKNIGDGSYGVVFKAIAPENEVVAIKKMKSKYKTWEDCNVLREIKCLKKLQHPNIVKLREVILANSELFLVFDYLDNNLYQVYTRAKESNRSLTEQQIRSIFFKIAKGLAYLHKNGFFHRDLKPQNILCHNNEVKICDFGLAREIRSRPPYTDYVSTRWYRAPELLLRGVYNSPVDIFALACIVVELYMMSPLFPGQNQIETMNKIVEILGTPTRHQWPEGYKMASTINYNFPEKKKKQLSDLIPNASPEAIELLESMLNYSSRKRPSASDLLKHEYFSTFYSGEDKPMDTKYETKFSFYQKNVIQIPKNLPIETNKEMEMRKSLIKFGSSFGSSFHLTKEEKNEKMDEPIMPMDLEFGSTPNKEVRVEREPKKKKYMIDNHDEIAKKFDQMEEILMELQKKEKDQKPFDSPPKKEKIDSPSKRESKIEPTAENDIKMPVFTFGGIGLNSFSSLGSLKNVKSPIFLKSKLGDSK